MKKLMLILGLSLVAVLLVFGSCAPAAMPEEEGGKLTTVPATPTVPSSGGVINEAGYDRGIAEPASPVVINVEQQWATERMIVRTGNMMLVVNDVPVAINQITGMADGLGGYVVSSRVWKEGERLVGTISIRVPAEHFNDTIIALRGLAVDVTSEQTSSRDVTEEYTDLSAKLDNLEATEAQLLKIMEKAETVEEILDVQRELSNTRDEIERTIARLQYLERTSATSLIDVYLEQSQLSIEFTADKRRGVKEGEKIQFTVRQIAGGFPPYSYEWDFGDGDISTDENPTHAYKIADYYTVSLKVTDDEGNTDTETRDGYITVIPGWSAGSIASGAWNGLVTFGHVLGNILIWLGIFSPVWIIVGGIVFWWQRRRRRKQAQ
ncbi:DUF4349 domain-containing protein [Chloroflexota bacterium]